MSVVCSTDELEKDLKSGKYYKVLTRVQNYIICIPSESPDEKLAKIHLAVTAWESLHRMKALEYKRAYKHALNLRYQLEKGGGGGRGESVRKGKRIQNDIRQATELQVKIAEECTECQKKLYLVERWQRQQLKKLKRFSTIEPNGYQPIRCL